LEFLVSLNSINIRDRPPCLSFNFPKAVRGSTNSDIFKIANRFPWRESTPNNFAMTPEFCKEADIIGARERITRKKKQKRNDKENVRTSISSSPTTITINGEVSSCSKG
jgi:hypothetical protein